MLYISTLVLPMWRLSEVAPLTDLTGPQGGGDQGSGDQTGTQEGRDLAEFLLKVIVPAAVGILILIAAVLVALIVVIHLRQRHIFMFRSKHNVQLISYLMHLCIEIEVALFIVCCGLPHLLQS